jgi:hypothetical protein
MKKLTKKEQIIVVVFAFFVFGLVAIQAFGQYSRVGPVVSLGDMMSQVVKKFAAPIRFNQCEDGIDNDNDNATDYPADFSCSSPEDNNEQEPFAECFDGWDNDDDGPVDTDDIGCTSYQDNNETNPSCSDGVDNDADGLIDHPADPGCTSQRDDDEFNLPSSGDERTSVSQNGITWTFDRARTVGQFANGDWWVVGPVTITTVSPGRTGTGASTRNGTEKNPTATYQPAQGFDGRATAYTESKTISFPVSLTGGDRLVSTISSNTPQYHRVLQSAAILTVVSAPVPANTFRPPYVGWNGTTFYSANNLRTNLLPSLAPVEDTPNISSVEAKFAKVNLDHKFTASGSDIWPIDNVDYYYGRELADQVGIAASMLLLDPARVGNKTRLAMLLTQRGIDNYGMISGGTYAWYPDNGHMAGRKFPIPFAGLMLNNRDMLDIGEDYGPNYFGEDGQTRYITQALVDMQMHMEVSGVVSQVGTNSITINNFPGYRTLRGNYIDIISGPGAGQRRLVSSDNAPWGGGPYSVVATLSQPWTTVPVVGQSVYRVAGYETSMIGTAEWMGFSFYDDAQYANPSWYQTYRLCCTAVSWQATALAARALGLMDEWNHPEFFDYVDRYMTNASPGTQYPETIDWRAWNPFSARMWDEYRDNF